MPTKTARDFTDDDKDVEFFVDEGGAVQAIHVEGEREDDHDQPREQRGLFDRATSYLGFN